MFLLTCGALAIHFLIHPCVPCDPCIHVRSAVIGIHLSFSTLICAVERRSLLSCQWHSCSMTAPCWAIYTFPVNVNVSVCPSGSAPMTISSFCNMSDFLSSLLLMLPLIRQVGANPMFLSFFLGFCFCLWCVPWWYHVTHHFRSFPPVLHMLYSAFKIIHHFLSISLPSKCLMSPLSFPLPFILLSCWSNNLKMFEIFSM